MPIDYGIAAPVAVLLALLVVVSALARRVPVVGTLVSIAVWGVMLVVLVGVVRERGRFDPLFARAAGIFGLDDQRVTGGETRIAMSPDGHFWARVTVDGSPRRMLVDSGATITALSEESARAAGLTVTRPALPMILRTANGAVDADGATIGTLRLGSIVARDLSAVVSPAFGDTDVLGMNFLSKLASWRVEGRTLILVPHHPQKVAERD